MANLPCEPNLTADLATILSPSVQATETCSPRGPPRAARGGRGTQSCAGRSPVTHPPAPETLRTSPGPAEAGREWPANQARDSPASPWNSTARRCRDSGSHAEPRFLRTSTDCSADHALRQPRSPRPLPAARSCSPGVARAPVGGARARGADFAFSLLGSRQRRWASPFFTATLLARQWEPESPEGLTGNRVTRSIPGSGLGGLWSWAFCLFSGEMVVPDHAWRPTAFGLKHRLQCSALPIQRFLRELVV